MDPNTAKTLGGIGSALTFLISVALFAYSVANIGTIHYPELYVIYNPLDLLWTLFDLIALTLILLSLRGLGSYYNDEGIKHNSLRWFIWWAVIDTAASYAITVPLSLASNVTISTLFIALIVLFLIVVISTIISAIYLKRAYAALVARTGEDLFNTAAKLYWWGSLLLVLLVGALLIWISWIISAIAFFSIKPQRPDANTAAAAIVKTAPPPPPNAAAVMVVPQSRERRRGQGH